MPKTERQLVKEALFKPRRKNKPITQPGWYVKKRRTVNGKLRQAIMDALPLNTTEDEADLILHTIFDCIVEGVIVDKRTSIKGFGRFVPHKLAAKYHHFGKKWTPAHYRVRFRANKDLIEFVAEGDGDSGANQGA